MKKKMLSIVIIILLISSVSSIYALATSKDSGAEEVIGYKLLKASARGGNVFAILDHVLLEYFYNPPYSVLGVFKNGTISQEVPSGSTSHISTVEEYNDKIYYFHFNRTEETLRVLVNYTDLYDIVSERGAFNFDTIIYNGTMFLFYRFGTIFTLQGINMTLFDGSTWSDPVTIIDPPSDASLTLYSMKAQPYRDNLYLFYRAIYSSTEGSYQGVHYIQSKDGTNWSEPLFIGHDVGTQQLRDVMVYEDKIYCFWHNIAKGVLEGRSYDGTTWSELETLRFQFNGKSLNASRLQIEFLNDKPYFFVWPTDGRISEVYIGVFDDWSLDSTVPITIKDLDNPPSIVAHDNKIWMFYSDGEYIRYITFDGEEFDYAGIVEPEPMINQVMDAIIRHWWLILLGGITVVVLWTRISKHKRESKEETPLDREANAEELSEFLSRRKEKE